MDPVIQESTEMVILGHQDDDSPIDMASEIIRLNDRIDQLERMLEQLNDTFDEVREVYHLY